MNKIRNCIITLLLLCAHTLCYGGLPPQIESAICNKEHAKLSALLLFNPPVPLSELLTAASASHNQTVLDAIEKAATFHDDSTFKQSQLVGWLLYFALPRMQENQNLAIQPSAQAPMPTQYSQKTHTWYIHPGRPIGKGHKKHVSKVLMYSPTGSFQYVACAEQHAPMTYEKECLLKLQNTTGVLHVFDALRFNGTTSLYCTLYNHGSLHDTLRGPSLSLTLKEKAGMALQILQGLEAIHAKKIIHRDLKSNNLLVNVSNTPDGRLVSVAITDFGRALPLQQCHGVRAHWNPLFTAPEGILYKKLHTKDYPLTDLFAAGCNIYEIFYDCRCPWCDKDLVKGHGNEKQRYDALLQKLNNATTPRRTALEVRFLNHTITPQEEFEYLILTSVHPDPKKRTSAHDLRVWLETIIARMS